MEVRGGYLKGTYVASGNLSQFRFVAGVGLDVYLPTSGARVRGVTQNHPNDNEHAALVTVGHTKITVANSLGGGIPIMSGNNGFAVQAQSGYWCAGTLEVGASSGCPGEMVFAPFLLTVSYGG